LSYNPKPGSRAHRVYMELLKRGSMTSVECAKVAGVHSRRTVSMLRGAVSSGAVRIEKGIHGWQAFLVQSHDESASDIESHQTGSVSVRRPRVACSIWDVAKRSAEGNET